MADSRTAAESRSVFQSSSNLDAKARARFYNVWAENYETDHSLMSYRAPHMAAEFLCEHFRGSREDVLVLDVACETGWIAKLMTDLGFRHFVGVDGSEGMLERAAETGLYQELKQALLGSEPLPTPSDTFDIVMIAGAQDAGFVPVSVVGELCQAAKAGGLVCMSRGHHTGPESQQYQQDLEQELRSMEDNGLWAPVGIKRVDIYMKNPHADHQGDPVDLPVIPGTVYLYQKCEQ